MHNRCRNRAAPIHGYDTNLAQWYHLLYFYSKNKRVHRASISESPALERLPPKTNTPKLSFQRYRFRSRTRNTQGQFSPGSYSLFKEPTIAPLSQPDHNLCHRSLQAQPYIRTTTLPSIRIFQNFSDFTCISN